MVSKKLTIIIPCYNCEETLEEAVTSIYEQNIDIPFEIIMVDDKSTDNTIGVMKNLSKKYSEIKTFYHDENKGGGATRNTAVKNSNGDIIFCLDSDDLLPPETLPKMYRYLEEKKCDGVAFHRSIKFNGRNKNNINHIDISSYYEQKIPIQSLLSKDTKFNPLDVNFMYTRTSFEKIKGYPIDHGFDTQGFCWRFLCTGLVAYTCPNTSYLHRINLKESYYLRNYNAGKVNYNWQKILLENYYILTKDAIDFIVQFNCKDFTRNILNELRQRENVIISNVDDVLGKEHPSLKIKLPDPNYVKVNSLRGFFFRIRNFIKKYL